MIIKYNRRFYTVSLDWYFTNWFLWNPTSTSFSPPFARGFVRLCDCLLNKQMKSSYFEYWNGKCHTPLRIWVKCEEGGTGKDLTEFPWLVKTAARQIKARLTRLLKKEGVSGKHR